MYRRPPGTEAWVEGLARALALKKPIPKAAIATPTICTILDVKNLDVKNLFKFISYSLRFVNHLQHTESRFHYADLIITVL